MGAYEDECEILDVDLKNGNIDIKEYNRRLKDIEDEIRDYNPSPGGRG